MTILNTLAPESSPSELLSLDVAALARVVARHPRRSLWPELTDRELAQELLREAAQLVHLEFKATCPKR